MKKIPRNVIVIAFVALASGFGQDLITPILPGALTLLGFSRAGIGLIDGLLVGAASLFRFASGIISDRFRNRKFFIFLGYALSSVSRPLLALFGGFGAIAALRTLDGVGKGIKDAPRDALVADSAAAEIRGRSFGFHRLVDTAGSVLGPILAAALLLSFSPTLRTYKVIFVLAAVPGIIALLLIFFGVQEPEKQQPDKIISDKKGLPWKFWAFTFGMGVAMLTKINDSLFLLRAHETGIAFSYIPILFAGFTALYALASYPIGIWSDKIGRLPLLAAGWLVLSVVELGFSNSPGIILSLGLFALYGLFYALTEGSGRAFIADLTPPESRGSAYAIFHTIIGLSVIAGGYGLGFIWDFISPNVAFAVAGIGSFFGFAILLALSFSPKSKTPHITLNI
ncbi:MFS transporter [Candidatus Uhrbacteria bacterium]|nr:MFS transporter [Candidatus Uhrbacteria bacterium]